MKRTILVTMVLCFAFAAVGYAERSPEEPQLNMALLKMDMETTRTIPATVGMPPTVNSEEEIPCFPNVTSEQEVPRWLPGLMN